MQSRIIAIHKPKGPTSHDIINRIRKITGIQKVGHAGTLDPLASGVLVVGIGREATKKLFKEVQKEKEYIAKIFLGQESATDDAEGQKTLWNVESIPTQEQINNVLKIFTGKIQQVPPQFSAKKIKGKPAYSVARKGETLELPAKEVEIKTIEMLSCDFPYLTLRVVTGPGAYIRSLARDLGRALACGGYLYELERTRVGEYTKEKSLSLKKFENQWLDKTKTTE